MPSSKFIYEAMPRRELDVFFVIDTSGGMHGKKISTLNNIMEKSITRLRENAI